MFGKIKSTLYHLYRVYKEKQQIKIALKAVDNRRTSIFLLQTPTHTNIGDHAIADAQIVFLKAYAGDYNLIEINQSLHFSFLKSFKEKVKSEDIVMLIGGGNFGNQYMFEENIRRSTFKAFPNNKVVVFPQTIYYTQDSVGKAELAKTQRIINAHKNTVLVAREEVSFHMMKLLFPKSTTLLTPDIVLSLSKNSPKIDRKGALMVLRSDEEKVLTNKQEDQLNKLVKGYFAEDITYSDMHWYDHVWTVAERNSVLDFKFNQFRSAELVITDRLHGMVFAAITGTPCIAFSNYNQKVSGTYEWIKDLNYIRFVDASTDINAEILQLLALQELTDYNPKDFQSSYQQIIDAIHE